MRVKRQNFFKPSEILKEVKKKIEKVHEVGEKIEYLTFVPDGEPTLDINLGREINLLKPLGIKIAVITNASKIWREDVMNELMKADWVSLKVDAASQRVWRRIDRPHRELELPCILETTLQFSKKFEGTLVSETMFLRGVNDSPDAIKEIGAFLEKLNPSKSYLSIPTRPPAEKIAHSPDEKALNAAYNLIQDKVQNVECLFGYEGNEFSSTGNVEEDLLNIIAVHPMREDAVRDFLENAGTDWSLINKLIDQDLLFVTEYEGKKFYLRRLQKNM